MLNPYTEKKFELGRVVCTPGVHHLIESGKISKDWLLHFVERHQHGDWGDHVCAEDEAVNEEALILGHRLFSSYIVVDTQRMWVITEADRSVTTLLLPREY